MFEQEIEMEKKAGSSFGPMVIVLILVGLFVGGLGVVIYQGNISLKPEEAKALAEKRVAAMEPVTVTFHTGNVSFKSEDSPSDPQYKLFEKAGYIKMGTGMGFASKVELTPAGKAWLASMPEVKPKVESPDSFHLGSTGYTFTLATRKLVAVNSVNKLATRKYKVDYSVAWQPTKVGEMFNIPSSLVQSLGAYDRTRLIDGHGANFYHAPPTQLSLVVIKGDDGWAPAGR